MSYKPLLVAWFIFFVVSKVLKNFRILIDEQRNLNYKASSLIGKLFEN
jgi:hypothetical protein